MPDMTTIRGRLADVCAAAVDPALTDDQLEQVLTDAAVLDANGRLPSADDWVGAWDFYGAAAAAWRLKAAAAAANFMIMVDNQQFARQQVFTQCRQMADWYSERAGQLIVGADGRTVRASSGSQRARTLYTDPNRWPYHSEGLIP